MISDASCVHIGSARILVVIAPLFANVPSVARIVYCEKSAKLAHLSYRARKVRTVVLFIGSPRTFFRRGLRRMERVGDVIREILDLNGRELEFLLVRHLYLLGVFGVTRIILRYWFAPDGSVTYRNHHILEIDVRWISRMQDEVEQIRERVEEEQYVVELLAGGVQGEVASSIGRRVVITENSGHGV